MSSRRLSVSIVAAMLLGLVAAPAFCSQLLVQGSFVTDDDAELVNFTVGSTQTVTIQSYGYAGGLVFTSPSPTTVAAGGFATNAILFDFSGMEITSDNGGHCGTTNSDPVTGSCNDAYIQESLAAGTYTLALLEWDNTTTDGVLADGFTETGNPGFTCAELGMTGNFCDVTSATGVPRDGNYAVAFSGEDLTIAGPGTGAPEPGTLLMMLSAGGLVGAVLLRRGKPGFPGPKSVS